MAEDEPLAPATPTTMAATDTMPSLAPRTPARSQFSRWATPPWCGSSSVSMALGEYVSVSSQSDSERALIVKESRELDEQADDELAELTGLYQAKGLRPATAAQVAVELTAHDALKAHLSAELNIDPDDVVSAWHAAGTSALAFIIGALLPLVAILLPPTGWRVPVTFAAVLVALAFTGALGAALGQSSKTRAAVRVVVGGALALAFTYGIGTLLGSTGIV